jgi:LysM repeat protein
MKTLKLVSLFVVVVLVAGLALTGPAVAQTTDDENERERSDNKILVTGVPLGWAVAVVPLGTSFPSGPGNSPDNAGVVTAYAPLNKTSLVYLWDGKQNVLIATVAPGSTFPDTVINGQVQYAQAFANRGLASPLQPNTGLGNQAVQAAPSQFTRQYNVQSGDTLAKIAQQFGISVADLIAANPNLLQPGQMLMVP